MDSQNVNDPHYRVRRRNCVPNYFTLPSIDAQVGAQTQTPYRISSSGGDIEVGFEVFPIDVDSRNPDGAVGRQVIESRLGPGTGGVVHGRQVSSLTSNFNVANPNTRQNQATFFETGPAPTTTTTTTTPKPVNIDLS